MVMKSHVSHYPAGHRNKRGLEYLGFTAPTPVCMGFEYWLLMVALWGDAVAGAPEVPLERLQSSNAPIRDPVVCRHSPTYIY